ncbi:MAG: FtsW/RodA/SpoVE family cell cycle protein [Propionibacteriaceae bacterium]|nr:FtsW/RodA/SpoVE family cell cycle protein [Propionibacteriaceae bacterium]
MAPETRAYRIRGAAQLVLILFGQSIGFIGYLLTGLFRDNAWPTMWPIIAICWYGLGIVIHIGVRVAIPYADPIMTPLVLTLTGLGLAELHRIDLTSDTSPMLYTQFFATLIGVAAFLAVIFLLKDPHRLKGYPFLLSALGFVLLLLPLIPGLGTSVYGSRIWINIAGFSFQPAEIAKIVLAASFAAYLADKREVLSSAGRRVLGVDLPRMRDLGPVMVMWGLSLAIMVFENDLGTSLLFFGLFVMMIYVATGKASWIILGLALFAAGGAAVIRFAGHVQRRIDFWLHPFDYPDDATQIIQAQFGLSHGGLLGSGWGLGRPDLIIFSYSDMISAALGEEIGIVGLMAVIVLYALLVFRGLKTSLLAMDPFIKLFAAGLSFAFLLQTFAIIGGVTRLLPLTGLTTPFLSQGGSSVIANWLLIAILMVMSHRARSPLTQLEVSASGVTELAEEHTQVFSTRELAQIGTGAIHPVQSITAHQVRLGPDGRPLDTVDDTPKETGADTPDWSGDEELTQAASVPGLGMTQPFTPFTGDHAQGEEITTHLDPASATGVEITRHLDTASATGEEVTTFLDTAPATGEDASAPRPTPPDTRTGADPADDDYFGRGTE